LPCYGTIDVEAVGGVLARSGGEGGRGVVWVAKGKVKILNV